MCEAIRKDYVEHPKCTGQTVGIIPARYASSRLPGKPLVDLAGQTMIERVWRATMQATLLHRVVVATDDERIAHVVRSFGGDVELTDPNLPSGTDRCYAVLLQRGWEPAHIVNVQGDEPLLDARVIDALVRRLSVVDCDVTTPIQHIRDAAELNEPSVVKVAVAEDGHALYFTRAAIATQWKHIGIYAYTWEALQRHIKKAPSQMEGAERLEQLRLLESGSRFQCIETTAVFQAVDTPEDVQRVLHHLMITD